MAWHISEVLTDLSFLPKLLANWHKDIEVDELEKLFSSSSLNIDLIDDDDIPKGYSNVYNWLAKDAEPTLYNAGLITEQRQLTHLARGIINNELSFYDALTAGIFTQPRNAILFDFMQVLIAIQAYDKPYSGLILLEALLVFQELDNRTSINDCLKLIINNRSNIEQSNDRTNFKTKISESILQHQLETIDITRTRTTLIWLIVNSLGVYEDLFGIQHIHVPELSKQRLILCKNNTNKNSLDLYNLLIKQK